MNAIFKITLFYLACIWQVGSFTSPAIAQDSDHITFYFQSPGTGFISLFNGTDFSGWNIEPDSGAWVVQDGEMRCSGANVPPYLIRTLKEFENFEMYVEFKMSADCNSGVTFFLPIVGAGRESRLGFEVQILDDGDKPPNKGSSGSIYDVIPPRVSAMGAPGVWNQYRIQFDWPACRIWLNGTLVQDTDFNHPVLKYRLRRGPLGVSNHGSQVSFRNFWIKELPAKEKWQSLFDGRSLEGWESIGTANWHVQDGMIVADKGVGYLVSKKAFENFHFQAYLENDKTVAHSGCFYFGWTSAQDPGYRAEFFSYPHSAAYLARFAKASPEGVAPAFTYQWLLYQIMFTGRESELRTAGYIVDQAKMHNRLGPRKIAIQRTAQDGTVRLQQIRIKPLDGPGL